MLEKLPLGHLFFCGDVTIHLTPKHNDNDNEKENENDNER